MKKYLMKIIGVGVIFAILSVSIIMPFTDSDVPGSYGQGNQITSQTQRNV